MINTTQCCIQLIENSKKFVSDTKPPMEDSMQKNVHGWTNWYTMPIKKEIRRQFLVIRTKAFCSISQIGESKGRIHLLLHKKWRASCKWEKDYIVWDEICQPLDDPANLFQSSYLYFLVYQVIIEWYNIIQLHVVEVHPGKYVI